MTRLPEFIECVAITAQGARVADLDENAKRLAASAFAGYRDPDKGWVTARGQRLVAYRRGYAEPDLLPHMGAKVAQWRADYLVGVTEAQP